MTLYDIIVPVAALLIAGVGVLIVHLTDPDRTARKKR
jgi:hypothetical protein